MSKKRTATKPRGVVHRFARRLSLEFLEERRLLAGDVQLLKDINAALNIGGSRSDYDNSNYARQERGIVVIGSTAYFGASSPTNGMELWKSDGTAAGTVRVTGIN